MLPILLYFSYIIAKYCYWNMWFRLFIHIQHGVEYYLTYEYIDGTQCMY